MTDDLSGAAHLRFAAVKPHIRYWPSLTALPVFFEFEQIPYLNKAFLKQHIPFIAGARRVASTRLKAVLGAPRF